MSTNSDSGQPSETNQKKRIASPSGEYDSTLPKQVKVSEEEPRNDSHEDAEPEKVGNDEPKHGSEHPEDAKAKDMAIRDEADAHESTGHAGGGESERQSSDSAAIAAAEALASLTGGNADEDCKEMPCSSKKASQEKSRDKSNRPGCSQNKRRTEAAAADSSSSLLLCEDREDPEQGSFLDDDDEEEDDDSLAASSSTASSSAASDNEDNEDGECAIVSVKLAPEVRQSVALLAQVQIRLDALEKKGARLHQRLEIKLSRQRRPHLDQRSAITQAIPGFWVTAVSFNTVCVWRAGGQLNKCQGLWSWGLNWAIYMCVCVCIYIYICVYIYMYIYVCIYMYMYVYIYVYVYVCVYMFTQKGTFCH